jgi:predicted CoA-binding protein
VDLVYCHRPSAELRGIAEQARSLGARAVWWQSGLSSEGVADPAGCWVSPQESREARVEVEAAGLAYLDAPYIADVARQLG